MSEIKVGDSRENSDITFEQKEQEIAEQICREAERKKTGERSPFTHFAQQNVEADALMKVAENPLAMKIYLLIIRKMNVKNALVASYQFFMDYFQTSRSSVKRAMKVLETENVLQVKRRGGLTLYLLNPNVVWKGKGNQVKYCEFESKIVFTEKEWSDDND